MADDDMPTWMVPDVYDKEWPSELKLSRTIQDWLEKDKGEEKSFKTIHEEVWGALGTGDKEDVPTKAAVNNVNLDGMKIGSTVFSQYVEVNNKLDDELDKWVEKDRNVAVQVANSKISVNNARDSSRKLISYMNTQAAMVPADMDENLHVLTYVSGGLDEALKTANTAKSEQEEAADKIRKEADANAEKELDKRIAALEQAQKKESGLPDDIKQPEIPDSPKPPGNVDIPGAGGTKGNTGIDDGTKPKDVDNSDLGDSTKDDTGLGSTKPQDVDNSGLGTGTTNGTGGIGDPSGVATPASYPQPASSATPGMDIGSLLAQQMMMRSLADRDAYGRQRDLDPSRYDDEIAPVPPQPVPAPVTAQPVAAQPATTAPAATQHAAAPTGTTTSSTQPTVAPGRTPGEDGSVVYTFPNGKTQKVSVTTAQGLDAAFGNHSGTDAQKAYEKTPAKWSDKKQIGQRVGDFQLMTGDVATWTNSTAILVVWPPEDGGAEGGTLEVIVKGELKPFDPKMPEIASETNSFEGFAHPNGIEVTAPADGAAPQTTPGSADQPADAAMPVAAMPAG
ncbi:hypothetical protein [Nocardia beijingensis]